VLTSQSRQPLRLQLASVAGYQNSQLPTAMVLYFLFLSWSGMGGGHISGHTRDFVLILHNHICVCDVIIFVLFDVHKYTCILSVYIYVVLHT
jgi:hypothetical protein